MKYTLYLIFIILTGCSGLPSKQTTSIQGSVDSLINTTQNISMPPYVFYSIFCLCVVLIAVIFLFIKSPLKR